MADPRAPHKNKATMADVAQRASVSKASVSRVLAGRLDTVTAETAERVLSAAQELEYVPNAIAASLSHRSSKVIGLLLADLANPFFAVVAAGIEATVQRAGYRMLVANTAGEAAREIQLTQLFLEQQVDALVVVTSALDHKHLRLATARGVSVTVVDSLIASAELDCVLADNGGGASAAARHLLDLGHVDVGVISGAPTDAASNERVEAAARQFVTAGAPLRTGRVLAGSCTVDGGHAATLEMLSGADRPTALFVTNNLMTVGALRAIAELGLHVPEDLSIVGFDDMDWYPIADPPITAVSQPAHAIGVRTAERVLDRMQTREPVAPRTIRLPTELIVRGSTAAPPARRDQSHDGTDKPTVTGKGGT